MLRQKCNLIVYYGACGKIVRCDKRFFSRTVRDVSVRRSAKLSTDENNDVEDETIQFSKSNSVIENDPNADYLGICTDKDASMVYGEYQYQRNSSSDAAVVVKHLENKYEPLLLDLKKFIKDKQKKTWFGQIRLDSENVPKFHGQFERSHDDFVKPTVNEIVQHIDQNKIKLKPYKDGKTNVDNNSDSTNSKESSQTLNYVDEDIEVVKSNSTPISLANSRIKFKYSGLLMKSKFKQSITTLEKNDHNWLSHEKLKRANEPVKGAPKPDEDTELSMSEKLIKVKFEKPNSKFKPIPESEILTGFEYLKQINIGKRVPQMKEEYENLKQTSQKRETILDSKGFLNLKNQVTDWYKLSNNEILDLLEKQIVFEEADVVGLNKPYGISIHGSNEFEVDEESKTISTSRVNSRFNSQLHLKFFLPQLAERLGCSKLYTVHRIDRDTTGLLLLTKTQQKAKELSNLFAEHKIVKKYLCITRGVPDHREGLIDIPIELGSYTTPKGIKRERMVLCPEPMEQIRAERRHSRTAKRAVTKYKVLSEHGNAALLEVFPETGIRHQIRVHLGFGLRCPILGDHKYSHLDRLAPQRLPTDMLMALRVRQSKARYVPMHLHAYQYLVPGAGDHSQNLFVRTQLPYHFKKNMSSLHLTLE